MSRIRTVKPEFWGHWKTARISRDARLLFLGLLNESDDYGKQLGSPRTIAGVVFPNDDDVTNKHIAKWLTELENVGLVERYEVAAVRYLFLPGFTEHQKVSHPADSRLPSPNDPPPELFPQSSGESLESLGTDLGSGSRIVGSLAPKARERDEIFDALCDLTGTDTAQLSGSGRGVLNRAVKELRALDASGPEVISRGQAFTRKYPNATMTAPALVKHWATLGNGQSSRASVTTTVEDSMGEFSRLMGDA